jgi:DNA polymerase-1
MFFDDIDLTERKRTVLKQLPTTPETGWLPPKEFPNLSQCILLGIDSEEKEMDIDHGPGWSRGKAKVVGASVTGYWRDGTMKSWYFPKYHEVEPEYNLDPEKVDAFLAEVLQMPIPKFGANLIYDTGNLADDGIEVAGELHDCQFSEALLDESGFVDLDYLGDKYLKRGKESNILYQWSADAYGGEATGKQRENIYRCSPRLVGPYAEVDSSLPIQIIKAQWRTLQAEGLGHIYRMECDLIRLWVAMRRQGVRVDVKKAEEMYGRIGPQINKLYERIYTETGVRAESTTGGDIQKIFKAINVTPPQTEKGNPSFAKEWLQGLDHPIADLVLAIRKLEILHNTFLKSYILDGNINGIIHGEFHPLRSDEGGTRVGRLSSSNPNLQNIPVREDDNLIKFDLPADLGNEIRKIFVPFEGHLCWEKGDFSQLQYRILAHIAVGKGSDELRADYNTNPDTDYHDRAHDLVQKIAGIEVKRKPIKNFNFGTMFGAGKKKVKRMLNVPQAIADIIFSASHEAAPYMKATMDMLAGQADTLGYVKSLLGRRFRFNLWEPRDTNYENRAKPLPYEWALRQYGQMIKRAMTHSAISGTLQGGEGDIMKTGMLRAWNEGVYAVTGVPTLTVHDENDHSVIDDSPIRNEAHAYLRHIMQTSLPLRVPIKFTVGRGPTWGDIE